MTMLPTVRRQLQEAAERSARSATIRTRPHVSIAALLASGGAAVALGVAILAILLLGHRATTNTLPAATKSGPIRRHHGGPLRLLGGSGIGNIRFGETATTASAALVRLFGPPASPYFLAHISSCHEILWIGLDVKPNARQFRGAHRLFRAELRVWFKGYRFVGYSYYDDHGIYGGAPDSETSIPLSSPDAKQLLHGHRLTLATVQGLVLGDSPAWARRLYGRAFSEIIRTRVTYWQASTASGRVYGSIANGPNAFYSYRSIAEIDAGTSVRTRCA